MSSAVVNPVSVPFQRLWSDHRTTGMVLIYGGLGLILAVPVLLSSVPFGVDDLNHMARIQVLAHIGTDPNLAHIFRVRHEIIPYLGMDLLLAPLAHVLPVLLVGRLFLVALVWGLVGVVALLQRVFTSRVGLGPAAVGLIAYNGLMAWGLINYVLGLIVALAVFAMWHAQRERPWPVRLALFALAATGVFLTHLLAFVIYGILVASYEAFGRPRPWRTPPTDWLVLVGQAAPALILWWAAAAELPHMAVGVPSYHLLSVLRGVLFPFLFRDAAGGSPYAALIAFVFCASTLYVAIRSGWATIPRTLLGPAIVMLVLTLVLPYRVFGVSLINYRPPVVCACLLIAGFRLTRSGLTKGLPIAAGIALLTLAHIADVATLVHGCGRQYAELRNALSLLPRGAQLVTVVERAAPIPGVACTRLPIYLHMDQLVTIDRSGYAPDFFSRVTSVAVRGGRPTDTDPIDASAFKTAPSSGYVLRINLARLRPMPSGLALIRRGSFFDLWAVAGGPRQRAGTAVRHPSEEGG